MPALGGRLLDPSRPALLLLGAARPHVVPGARGPGGSPRGRGVGAEGTPCARVEALFTGAGGVLAQRAVGYSFCSE